MRHRRKGAARGKAAPEGQHKGRPPETGIAKGCRCPAARPFPLRLHGRRKASPRIAPLHETKRKPAAYVQHMLRVLWWIKRTELFSGSILLSIFTHALREEGDSPPFAAPRGSRSFLSTPSARRATCKHDCKQIPNNYFYPRPPRGGRHTFPVVEYNTEMISIHALREEGDPVRKAMGKQ